MNEKDKAAFEAAWKNRGWVGADVETAYVSGFKAALAHRDEQIKGLVEALSKVLAWDEARKYIMPYKVRDPIRAALAAYKESGV